MAGVKLGVNVDHIATLRQARKTTYPDPVAAAKLAQAAGADNITCHLREDRRHIQDQDVVRLKNEITIPLNFEMAATKEMVAFAKKIRPQTVTLVPERREELTTEGGLDVFKNKDWLRACVEELRLASIEEVSMFVNPDERSIQSSKELGANAVELHTGKYCEAIEPAEVSQELEKLSQATEYARNLGLAVHAGHGLHEDNVVAVAKITGIDSLQIGHGIVSKAVYIGIHEAVIQMKQLITIK